MSSDILKEVRRPVQDFKEQISRSAGAAAPGLLRITFFKNLWVYRSICSTPFEKMGAT